MTQFMVNALDPFQLQSVKHRDGLQSVAEGFAAGPLTMPLDVHELFRRYLVASETIIVPRLVFLQMFYDLSRAWDATGKDQAVGSPGQVYKTMRDVVERIMAMPGPFRDLEPSPKADTAQKGPAFIDTDQVDIK